MMGCSSFHTGGGHVRRLQALGNVSAHGDRGRAIAATQDRVFHADLHGSDLRQRNPLARRANQGEVGDLARIEPRVSGRTGVTCTERMSFADLRDRDARSAGIASCCATSLDVKPMLWSLS